MADEDSPLEDDEEESLVYVEFEGADSDVFSNEKLKLDMIGLDMEHPIMRVNGRYYEGTYEDAVGTYMFFEKDKNPTVDDPVFDIKPKLKYSNKTKKILKMKRVFVKPRLEVLGDSNHPSCIPNIETIEEAGIPPTCQQEALNLWNEMRNERLEALNDYLEKQKIREEKRQQGIEPDSESDEDNPFAMYKLDINNSEDSQKDECHESIVIDPGPSTSSDKNFTPDGESLSTVNSSPKNSNLQAKNQGYLGICSRQKLKNDGKKGKKIQTHTKTNVDESNVIASEKEVPENRKNTDILVESSEAFEELAVEISEKSEKKENSNSEISSQLSEEISQCDIVDQVPDKKLEKQLKRVAKEKEISERLKKTADEIKSKVNQ